MMLKYKTDNWHCEIEEVEVIKETEKQVIKKDGRKSAKISEYECFFDTFEEATQYLTEKVLKEIHSLNFKLENKERKLNKILAIIEENKGV